MTDQRLFPVDARAWSVEAWFDVHRRSWSVKVRVAGPRQSIDVVTADLYSGLTLEEAHDVVDAVISGLKSP